MRIEVIQPSQIPESWYGEIIGFDIETEDKHIDSPICMVSIWKPKEPVIYIIPIKVYRHGILEEIAQEELSILKRFISTIRVVGYQLQFDLGSIGFQWGATVADIYMDLYLVARILQLDTSEETKKEEESGKKKIALKKLILRVKPELASSVRLFEDVVTGKPPFTYEITNPAVTQYSGLDAYFPFVLMQGLIGMIRANEKIIKLETEMLKTAVDQKVRGLRFNQNLFETKVEEFSSSVETQNEELDRLVGWHVRHNATADKKKLLIDTYGCEPTILTKTGAPSMSSEALEMMRDNDSREEVRDLIDRILGISKNFSTYNSVKKLPNFINGENLYFNVEQIGFDGTARIYTKDFAVNMLSWPMREAVIAPKGKKFLFFDYKAAELFIVLNWSGCQKGVEWYNSGIDLHREVMKEILGKEDITSEERNQSKVLSFSQIYGGSADTIRRDLNCSIQYAEQIYEGYQELFPEIVQFRNQTIAFAHQNGYTTTLLGRKRKLQNINSNWEGDRAKDERRSFNTRIQGTCADLLKTACNRCYNEFKDEGVRVAFTVFDSFLLEVPEEMTEERCIQIMERMSDFTDIQPGLKIRYDWGIGHNWKEAHDNAD